MPEVCVPSSDMFPQNIFRSVRMSLYTPAQLPLITALLTAVQKPASLSGCADFSWSRLLDRRSSDKYPAQVGGAYGDAAGDSSVNSGSASSEGGLFTVSVFPVMLFQQVSKAGISLITVFKAQQDGGFSKELEDEMFV